MWTKFAGEVDAIVPCPTPFLYAVEGCPSILNPTHQAWIQQDQSTLSVLISSLCDETMYLVVGHPTSGSMWQAVELVLGSSTRIRSLSLLS